MLQLTHRSWVKRLTDGCKKPRRCGVLPVVFAVHRTLFVKRRSADSLAFTTVFIDGGCMLRDLLRVACWLALAVVVVVLARGPAVVRAANPPIFVPCGDVNALANAIRAANDEQTRPGPDTIRLAAGCSYKLRKVFDPLEGDGATGLPLIRSVVTITGYNTAIMRDAGGGIPQFRLVRVVSGGSLRLEGLTLRNGDASETLAGGGAILNEGRLELFECTLDGNTARMGGAVANRDVLRVERSLFRRNSASLGGGAVAHESTGPAEPAYIGSSTLAENSAPGGAAISAAAPLKLEHATIFDSRLPEGSTVLGSALRSTAQVIVINTLIQGGAVPNCDGPGMLNFVHQGGSLQTGDASCPGIPAVPDLLLSALADRGGATDTALPLPGSPALGAAVNCAPGALDQRGVPRADPVGGACDAGAAASAETARSWAEMAPVRLNPGENGLLTIHLMGLQGAPLTGMQTALALPEGLAVDGAGQSDCGGQVTQTAGGRGFTLRGAGLAAGASCALRLPIRAEQGGLYALAAGPVQAAGVRAGPHGRTAGLLVRAPVQVALEASPQPAVVGAPARLEARVWARMWQSPPSGLVSFHSRCGKQSQWVQDTALLKDGAAQSSLWVTHTTCTASVDYGGDALHAPGAAEVHFQGIWRVLLPGIWRFGE
jgi:hypothetical protein